MRADSLGTFLLLGRPVQVWCAAVGGEGGPERAADLGMLHASEVDRMRRILPEDERAAYVAGRALVRHVLAAQLQMTPEESVIVAGGGGRPRLVGPRNRGVDFSLSHSSGLVAVAVSTTACVGIDIEQLLPGRPFEEIARRFFAPEERALWARTHCADRLRTWYRIWTRREAYVKATGDGLRGIGREHPGRGSGWDTVPLDPAPGYVGSLVVLGEGSPARLTLGAER
ncbi:4'-phosphopantetheinyl transferase superfamily protein [Streptomyces sp. NPDC052036]|uniref:4'-phosphopantetheinyl transferase family protein n=1 Tax=unclassified Streptomyces TaxID=2593676 RepID=UPI00341C3118